jgi:hypothetical protein
LPVDTTRATADSFNPILHFHFGRYTANVILQIVADPLQFTNIHPSTFQRLHRLVTMEATSNGSYKHRITFSQKKGLKFFLSLLKLTSFA